jgi:glutamate racemase
MILGCTHYPLLRSKIRSYMGERIQIVNPAYETAMDLKRLLQSEDMENDGEEGTSSKYEFYVSDAAEKFVNFANTVMPFDISKANIVNIEEY